MNHIVVINKDIHLCLHPNLIAWLVDFLNGRRQAVRYQGCVSSLQYLTMPSPTSRIIGRTWMTVPLASPSTPGLHTWSLQAWAEVKKVSINHTKTVVMQFCTSSAAVVPPHFSVSSHPLQVVQSTRLLGMTLDDQLNWKQHVTHIIRSASYRIYLLWKLRSLGTPADELKEVYTSFMLPKFMYASLAWSSSLNLTQQHQFEKVQKRACKVILGLAFGDYGSALSTLSLPRLSVRHEKALRKLGEGLLKHPRHHHLLLPDAPLPLRATRYQNILITIKGSRTDYFKKSAILSIVSALNSV